MMEDAVVVIILSSELSVQGGHAPTIAILCFLTTVLIKGESFAIPFCPKNVFNNAWAIIPPMGPLELNCSSMDTDGILFFKHLSLLTRVEPLY